ncbi:MAG: hypothetical protein WA268_15425, partial [Xanthobacteraceae bacterium]
MSESDTMRLAAEVVDKYSPVLRQMQRSLRDLTDYTRKSNEQSKRGAKEHREEIGRLDKAFGKVEERVKGSVIPTIAALGVTTLSAGAAVATLKDTVLGFGETGRQLSMLSRETGFSVQRLRELEAVGRRLNIAPDSMRQSMRQFAQHMHDLRRMVPAEIDTWLSGGNVATNNFVRSIANMPIQQALSRALGFLQTIHDPQEKTKFLRMLGLPENYADVPIDRLRSIFAEVRKSIGVWGPDEQRKADAFEVAIDRMRDSVDKLKVDVGTDLADSFTQAVNAIRKFVDENRSDLLNVLKDVSAAVKESIKDLQTLLHLYGDVRSGKLSEGSKKFLFGGKGDPTDPLGTGHSFTDEPFFKGLGWLKDKWDQLNS